MSQENPSRIIKADKSLQQKVGTGNVQQNILDRAETVMQNTDTDFAPIAQEFLTSLAQAVSQCRKDDFDNKKDAIAPVMQLKANAKIFGYGLVGDMANIMLNFMETIEELDKDAIDILSAHHKTLTAIIGKEMKGDGGDYGRALKHELNSACQRYLRKFQN